MNKDHDKVQFFSRMTNLVICVAFLSISITRVNMDQWGSYWIWIWGLLTLLNAVFLVIKAVDLKSKK